MRTANETAEAVDFINREYLGSAPAPDERQPPIETPSAAGTSGEQKGEQSKVEKQVQSPLTLIMDIKSKEDYTQLKRKIERIQGLPPDQNPIIRALNEIGTVHFARFVFLGEQQLAVITTYDGSFDRYIDAFVNVIGKVFDDILQHVSGAPPLPVSDHREEFLDYVRKHDVQSVQPFYSAYPRLRVLDILELQRKNGR